MKAPLLTSSASRTSVDIQPDVSVNYILEGDGMIFSTVPDGEVFRHALEITCACEIDEIEEFYQSGRSVLAVGGGVRRPPVRQDPGAMGGRSPQHVRPAAVRAADRPPGVIPGGR